MSRVLFEPEALGAAMLSGHPRHAAARRWLERAVSGEVEGLAPADALSGLYRSLTAGPTDPPIRPAQVLRLLDENLGHLTLVPQSAADHRAAVRLAASRGLTGSGVGAALLVQMASRSQAEAIVALRAEPLASLSEVRTVVC